MSTRPTRVTVLLVAGLLLAVSVGYLLVPWIIVDAYGGNSIGPLNDLISGQDSHPVEFYISAWYRLMFLGTGTIVVLFVIHQTWHTGLMRRVRARLLPEPHADIPVLLSLAVGIGAAAGLATAIVRAAIFLVERHPSRRFQWEGVWMAPLSTTLTFLVASALALFILWAISRVWSSKSLRLSLPAFAFVLTFIAAWGLFLERIWLARYAMVVLSLGLATVVAARVHAVGTGKGKTYRRAGNVLAGLAVITFLAGTAWLPSRLEARHASAVPVGGERLPDIVLIILDTVRASSLSLYGHEHPTTPLLDQRALDGIVFEQAIAPTPWTLPSHATLFTGRWAHELNVGVGRRVPSEPVTLAEVLNSHGYRTAAFTANVTNAGSATGLDRGFARFEDIPITWRHFVKASWLGARLTRSWLHAAAWDRNDRDAADQVNSVLRWVEGARADQPVFLFVNLMDAHAPYHSPPEFRRRFPSDQPVLLPRDLDATPEYDQLAGTRAAYDAAIAYLDSEVDRMLDGVRRLRPRDRLVVITSDHGEYFGEHALIDHGRGLYEPVIRVPLLMFLPGGESGGQSIERPVSLRDLGATILDVAGLPSNAFPGRSIASTWSAEQAAALPVFAQTTDTEGYWAGANEHVAGMFYGRLAYIRSKGDARELYRMDSDPAQSTNLSGRPEYAAVESALEAAIDSVLSMSGGPRGVVARDRDGLASEGGAPRPGSGE